MMKLIGNFKVEACSAHRSFGTKVMNIPASTYQVFGHPEMADVSLSNGASISVYDIAKTEFDRLVRDGLAKEI